MWKIPQWIVGYGVAIVVVVAATVLVAMHQAVPAWFSDLAIFAAGGSTGAVVSSHTVTP